MTGVCNFVTSTRISFISINAGAHRNHLKSTCKQEQYALLKIKANTTKDNCKNNTKIRPLLAFHLQCNDLLVVSRTM